MSLRQWPRVVAKEAGAGFMNGVAVAATTALGVYFWSGSIGLVNVIAASMVIAMVIAGVAGLGQDPATASSIVLTTVTDIAGFFSFLGIATLLSGSLS
jgi:magnesium transporter